MMRYSEISRDLSADSMKFVEHGREEYIYKSLRDESPHNDIKNASIYTQNNVTTTSNNFHTNHQRNGFLPTTNEGSTTNYQNNKSFQKSISIPRSNGSFLRNGKDCDIGSGSSKGANIKSSRRKNSIGSALGTACLNAMSSSPSGCYYHYGSTPPGKTQSLPSNASIKNYDDIILSALRVSPEDLANQITLLDFPSFSSIQPEELTSCSWTKKDKQIITPNIVAFTKRFNHTSFWTVQEILSGDTPKIRGEILVHFIKVAKKLYELNNLHSLFSIISAMQTASIYRLKKTWSCLSKKDKQSFDRLADIFSDTNNWENLRKYLESLRLPCIPYLGLFLTDLIYIDLAHPHNGGLESESRRNKMNNILRVILNYQHSDYTYIHPVPNIQKYLQSIRYIEELQNIFEEDQYKKSLKLEPQSGVPSSSSCSSKESFNINDGPTLACLNLSPAKTVGSMRIPNGSNKFIPGHRKCRSLGSKFRSTSLPRNFYQKCQCPNIMICASGIGKNSNKRCNCRIFGKVNNPMDTIVYFQNHTEFDYNHPRHLLDDSVLEDQINHQYQCTNNGDAVSTESSEGAICHYDFDGGFREFEVNNFQGCVRRKTILKEGRKPAVASWQRYWLQIWANSLVYFPPKSFKGSERSDFKREPCKVCPLNGWSAQTLEQSKHKNSFEFFNKNLGTVYKFRTDCPRMTEIWVEIIKRTAHHNVEKPLPINLMSFE